MSSKFNYKKIMPRYSVIAIVMTFVAIAVVFKAFYTMTVKKEYWEKVASRLKVDSVEVKPVRGNILSSDGQLMASSLPEYKIYMDFNALHKAGNDSLWDVKMDSIAIGLNQIFPEQSAEAFRDSLEKGHRKMSMHWPIWKKRIGYSTLTEIKALPVFCLSKYNPHLFGLEIVNICQIQPYRNNHPHPISSHIYQLLLLVRG